MKDTVAQAAPSQVFVDASGRRARRVTRCGYLLGLGCVGYIGMVAMGLSGTRVAALPGVPVSAENEIVAGLSGEAGSYGLHLTPAPVTTRVAARNPQAHPAAVRGAAARTATPITHPTAAGTRSPVSAVTGRPAPRTVTDAQSRAGDQVLAEGTNPAEPAYLAEPSDPSQSKSEQKAEKADQKAAQKAQEKAQKADYKGSKRSSDDKSY